MADHWRERYAARAEVREPGAAARSRLPEVYKHRHAALAPGCHLVAEAGLSGVEPVVVETIPGRRECDGALAREDTPRYSWDVL